MRDASKSRCPTLYFLLPIVDPARVLMDNSLFGSRVIMSEISQFNASQSRSKCSRLIRAAISWYRSLIVPALIPVILDMSACVSRFSPKSLDPDHRSAVTLDTKETKSLRVTVA